MPLLKSIVGFFGQAVLVLEAAQVARRVSAPLRLAAMGLYGLLGAPTMALESFTALDIKHIQHDTLSGVYHNPERIFFCTVNITF